MQHGQRWHGTATRQPRSIEPAVSVQGSERPAFEIFRVLRPYVPIWRCLSLTRSPFSGMGLLIRPERSAVPLTAVVEPRLALHSIDAFDQNGQQYSLIRSVFLT